MSIVLFIFTQEQKKKSICSYTPKSSLTGRSTVICRTRLPQALCTAPYLPAILCCLNCVVLEGQCEGRGVLTGISQEEPCFCSCGTLCSQCPRHPGWSSAVRGSRSSCPGCFLKENRRKRWGLRGALTLCWTWVILQETGWLYGVLQSRHKLGFPQGNLVSPHWLHPQCRDTRFPASAPTQPRQRKYFLSACTLPTF